MNDPNPQEQEIEALRKRLDELEKKDSIISTLVAKTANSYKSFTILFNAAGAAAAGFIPYAQDNIPALQQYLGAHAYQQLTFALLVGNIILRYKTKLPLEQK